MEVVSIPHRDRDGLYASVLESWQIYGIQKELGVATSVDLSYLSELYCQGSELQQVMVAWIAEVLFSILSPDTCLQAARVGVAECLSFDHMITSCIPRGTILRFPPLLINEWFSFGIIRLFGRVAVNSFLAFAATASL